METSDNNCGMDDKNVLVSELSLSPRLRNILRREGCVRVRDIERYSRDSIIRFRNLGLKTYEELMEICDRFGIRIYDSKDLNDKEHRVHFSYFQYQDAFNLGIKCKEDVWNKSLEELKELAGNDRTMYAKFKILWKYRQ